MTIQTYPTSPLPSYPYQFQAAFKTLINEFDAGNEQRRMLRRFPKRTVTLVYNNIEYSTDWYPIENFFHQRFGGYDSFWFVDFAKRKWVDEYVGRGTAGALTLDLHSKTTTVATLKIYEDAVEQVKDTDYTFVSGGGEAGSDRITWIAGHYPATGALITSDFEGFLRIKARLSDQFSDSISAKIGSVATIGDIQTVTLSEVQW